VTFGCALMVHEKQTSFIWVLKQLVEVEDVQQLEAFVTDSDKAIPNAIKLVFSEAQCRLCL